MEMLDRKFLNVQTETCHASTIAFFKNEPIFAWFGSDFREGASDSCIYVQCRSKVHKLENRGVAQWNPVLFTFGDKLWLCIKQGEFCDRWSTLVYDLGGILEIDFYINKLEPQIIPAGLNMCVKTKPIIRGDFSIYCGSSVETLLDWTAYAEIYNCYGNEFELVSRSKPLTVAKQTYFDDYYGRNMLTKGIIQGSLYIQDDKMKALFRASRGLGNIYYSEEHGENQWGDPIPTPLKNPNSSVDTVVIDNRLYLAYNPSETKRCPLVISRIGDKFAVEEELVISDREQSGLDHTEFSYPFVIENDGKIHLTYTYLRKKIEHVIIKV